MAKKKIYALFLTLFFVAPAFAGTEMGGNTELSVYLDPLSNLMLSIGLLIGTYGGYKVYIHWNSGDRHVSEEIMGWFGGCIFLVLTAIFVKAMFT